MRLVIKYFFIVLFLISVLPVKAYYNPGKPTGFVNDYAHLLTSDQRVGLENRLAKFEKDTTNEISVVTIPDLQGDTIENFANQLFNEWGIGKKGKDNGILVLVALQDKKMRIEVGYGMEGLVTDAQASWIISDIMRPAFKDGNYFMGINGAVAKIISSVNGGDAIPTASAATSSQDSKDTTGSVLGVIFFVAYLLMGFVSMLGRTKSWWLGGAIGGFVGLLAMCASIKIGLIVLAVLVPSGLLFDFLVSKLYGKYKSRGHVPWWLGGNSGSSGGFGGGFGGFGGGGSGGGGASGGW